ncbi:MAG: alanine racemase [Anaerolineales bacterium]|nr:alanine racemase [Anaerolineales bacterium]
MQETDGLSNWLEIDLRAISNNVVQLQRITGVDVMAVVKANAYGHGLVPVAREAVNAGASYCGVARIDEALELRMAGLRSSVLVLGETPPGRFGEAISNRVSLTVFREDHLDALRSTLDHAAGEAVVHLKVDTGMSRLGASVDQALELLRRLHELERVQVEGLFTHFARADEPQVAATEEQERLFADLLEEVTSAGLRPPIVHAANSAAALSRPSSRFDMVRPGIAMYGLNPSDQVSLPKGFQRALAWKAHLSQIRRVPPGTGISYGHDYVTEEHERIGVVSVGYGDGYRREPGNEVLIRGVKVPVRGRVCMDQIIVDLSSIPDAQVGDAVILVGADGSASVTVDDLAATWDSLNYEVVCGLNARVPRLYQT